MEASKQEALKAIEIAEKRFAQRDFAGAKNYALKAKALCPELEGIPQMVATFQVYVASEARYNGELDYYSILGTKPSADIETVRKQYRKLAVLLHPDKNKCVGADGAFKLVSEAWTWLSDNAMRSSYDLKRNAQMVAGVNQTNFSSVHSTGTTGYNKCFNLSTSHGRHDTFWTICTSCKVQYEYLRKYVNKRLSCKNCRGAFIAVETGAAPANGSFPYSPWSYVPGNGYGGGHSFDNITYMPTSATYFNGNGVAGYHSAHGYDYVSNVSFQWSPAGHVNGNGPTTLSSDSGGKVNGTRKRGRPRIKPAGDQRHQLAADTAPNVNSDVSFYRNEPQENKPTGPDKKRKVVVAASFRNGCEQKELKFASESRVADGNESITRDQKLPPASEVQSRQFSMAPAFDARKLLIEKAKKDIQKKLEEMKLASNASSVGQKAKSQAEVGLVNGEGHVRAGLTASDHQLEHRKTAVAITVPDSDFHDFDKDRSEQCFRPKQIWALYDEEDGMPRLYCLIREVISVNPFKIHISYLNSKTDSEFGPVNWMDSGFTKSCGNFRTYHSDVVHQVNIFSHVLAREKAGRGGCIRIYPRCGDVWAVYRNWSSDWNRFTPDEVRHQYEMVEVLDDYSEELGVCVCPLVKMAGFKTVYQTNSDKKAIRWIPRREMVRFSHQVPSWLLKGETTNLPERCWDLDPAATPDELLHASMIANDS